MGSRAAWRKALALISLALVLLLARVNGDESASDPGRVADAGGDVANGGDGANGGDVANGEEAGKEGGNAGKDGIKVPTPLKDEQDPMDDAIKKGLYFYVTQVRKTLESPLPEENEENAKPGDDGLSCRNLARSSKLLNDNAVDEV